MRKVCLLSLCISLFAACGVDQNLLEALAGEKSVQLVFPENISECTEGTIISETQSEVVFRWTDIGENSNYQVNLTNLISNTTETITSTSTELAITLERGIPYSWFISDSIAGVVRSDVWSFYNAGPGVESYIPFPAAAIAPVSGTIITISSSIDLVWNASDLDDDIVEYDIYFGLDANPPLFREKLIDSFLNDVTITSGVTYYWKVITRDSIGNESNSEIFNFQVE